MSLLMSLLLASSIVAGIGADVVPTEQLPEVQLMQVPDVEIPDTIRVRLSGTGGNCYNTGYDGRFKDVVEMDFKEYVTSVLAGEFGNRWSLNSLRAGAIAVKMYGMAAIQENPKYHANPWAQDRVADVYDCNWDQVPKPDWVNDKVRRAVEDTWNYVLVRENGEIFYTYHDTWHHLCIFRGEEGNCMGQWDSYEMALVGTDWRNILMTFYEDSVVLSTDGSYYQDEYVADLDGQYIEGESNAYVVQLGDTLTSIAKAQWGDSSLYIELFNANTDILSSPSMIRAGQVIILPEL